MAARLLRFGSRVPPAALFMATAAAAAGSGLLGTGHGARAEDQAVADAPSFTERTVGNYENRLRKFSAPERVFEYFSSVEIDKQFFMTRDDLARAITPYTYRHGAPLASKNPKFNAKARTDKTTKEVAEAYLHLLKTVLLETPSVTTADVNALLKFHDENHIDFETHVKTLRALQITNVEYDQFIELHGGPPRPKTFFDLVDADGDGLISYAEYMFFNTLLAIPQRQFELAFKMFDTDGNGRLDHREFKQIMELLRLRTPAGRQDRSLKEDDSPIFKHLFGELATETLSYEDFCTFRRDLQQEILRIQFEQYDLDHNKELSPREFGMFLVSHVNQVEIDKWVKRVEGLRTLKGHVTEQEFMDFNVFLEHLDEMKVAIDLIMQDRGLNKDQFLRATKAAVHGQKKANLVTPLQVDILFALFDDNGDGFLSPTEFIDVMQKRKDGGFNARRDTGAFELIKRVKRCIEGCV